MAQLQKDIFSAMRKAKADELKRTKVSRDKDDYEHESTQVQRKGRGFDAPPRDDARYKSSRDQAKSVDSDEPTDTQSHRPKKKENDGTANDNTTSADPPRKLRRDGRPSRGALAREDAIQWVEIFCGGLPDDVDLPDLRKTFEKFGTVLSIDLHNRYAFLRFNTKREAEAACKFWDSKRYLGRELGVRINKVMRSHETYPRQVTEEDDYFDEEDEQQQPTQPQPARTTAKKNKREVVIVNNDTTQPSGGNGKGEGGGGQSKRNHSTNPAAPATYNDIPLPLSFTEKRERFLAEKAEYRQRNVTTDDDPKRHGSFDEWHDNNFTDAEPKSSSSGSTSSSQRSKHGANNRDTQLQPSPSSQNQHLHQQRQDKPDTPSQQRKNRSRSEREDLDDPELQAFFNDQLQATNTRGSSLLDRITSGSAEDEEDVLDTTVPKSNRRSPAQRTATGRNSPSTRDDNDNDTHTAKQSPPSSRIRHKNIGGSTTDDVPRGRSRQAGSANDDVAVNYTLNNDSQNKKKRSGSEERHNRTQQRPPPYQERCIDWVSVPPELKPHGLTVHLDFISEKEERELIASIEKSRWSHDITRDTQQYGATFDYSTRHTLQALPEPALPSFFDNELLRLLDNNYFSRRPDQIIINKYVPGQGIANHTDRPDLFGPVVASLSLQSEIGIVLTHPNRDDNFTLWVPRRSLLVFAGDARYKWQHGIKKDKTDWHRSQGLKPRGTRISITFRTLSDQERNRLYGS